jgi:hypothetical protein
VSRWPTPGDPGAALPGQLLIEAAAAYTASTPATYVQYTAAAPAGATSGSIQLAPRPTSRWTALSTGAVYQDNNSNGNANSADVLRITFDEVMAAPAAPASITLTDADGTASVGTVTNGVNSTWTLSSDSRTIIITLPGSPVVTTAGTAPGVQYPATVTAASNVTDTGANNTSRQRPAPEQGAGLGPFLGRCSALFRAARDLKSRGRA